MSELDKLLDTPVEQIQKSDRSEEYKQSIQASYSTVTHNIELPPPSAGDMFRIMSWEDLAAVPDPQWLIETILIEGSFNILFGAPGVGKSFVALSIALSIAHGIPTPPKMNPNPLTKPIDGGMVYS